MGDQSQPITMLVPKANRQAVYKYLFKEGVMVAKKDFNKAKHDDPDLDVPNLHVVMLMQSQPPSRSLPGLQAAHLALVAIAQLADVDTVVVTMDTAVVDTVATRLAPQVATTSLATLAAVEVVASATK